MDGERLREDYKECIVHKAVFEPQFYVEEDHLVFLFSQEELAGYAYGPIFLQVPLGVELELNHLPGQYQPDKWIPLQYFHPP